MCAIVVVVVVVVAVAVVVDGELVQHVEHARLVEFVAPRASNLKCFERSCVSDVIDTILCCDACAELVRSMLLML